MSAIQLSGSKSSDALSDPRVAWPKKNLRIISNTEIYHQFYRSSKIDLAGNLNSPGKACN